MDYIRKKAKQLKKGLIKFKLLLLLLGGAALFGQLLFFQSTDSLLLIFISLFWFILGLLYRFDEKYFFALAIVFLVLTVPPFLLGNYTLAEKFSVWQFLFLTLGLWQGLVIRR